MGTKPPAEQLFCPACRSSVRTRSVLRSISVHSTRVSRDHGDTGAVSPIEVVILMRLVWLSRFYMYEYGCQGRNLTANAGLSGPLTESQKWFEVNGISSGLRTYDASELGWLMTIWAVFGLTMYVYCTSVRRAVCAKRLLLR
jgi:hypothetical protein